MYTVKDKVIDDKVMHAVLGPDGAVFSYHRSLAMALLIAGELTKRGGPESFVRGEVS